MSNLRTELIGATVKIRSVESTKGRGHADLEGVIVTTAVLESGVQYTVLYEDGSMGMFRAHELQVLELHEQEIDWP